MCSVPWSTSAAVLSGLRRLPAAFRNVKKNSKIVDDGWCVFGMRWGAYRLLLLLSTYMVLYRVDGYLHIERWMTVQTRIGTFPNFDAHVFIVNVIHHSWIIKWIMSIHKCSWIFIKYLENTFVSVLYNFWKLYMVSTNFLWKPLYRSISSYFEIA